MCQNIGDEVYLFYIFIIYIVDIGKIIIKECENGRMNDQEGSTRGQQREPGRAKRALGARATHAEDQWRRYQRSLFATCVSRGFSLVD